MDRKTEGALGCAVVRDLLPSYAEGLTSDETSRLVAAHLEGCANCSAVHEKMTEPAQLAAGETGQPGDVGQKDGAQPGADGVRYLKKVKRRHRLTVLAVVLAVLVLVGGVGVPVAVNLLGRTLPLPVTGVTDVQVYGLENGDLYFRLTVDEKYAMAATWFHRVDSYGDGWQMELNMRHSPLGRLAQYWLSDEVYFLVSPSGARHDDGVPVNAVVYATGEKGEHLVLWREGDVVPAAPAEVEAMARQVAYGPSWFSQQWWDENPMYDPLRPAGAGAG